jgi:uncharacterized protein (TIGR03435 family)
MMNIEKVAFAIAGILAVAIPLFAQSDLRFEVATVRRVEIPATDRGVPVFLPTGGVGTSNPSRITYPGTWLMTLITAAFGVRPEHITGPPWLATERYDIVANIPEGTTKEQFNVMLGNLLRDRFNLRFHIESKVQPVYALRVPKTGPKFKETAVRPDADDAATRSKIGPPDEKGFPTVPPDFVGMVSIPVSGQMFLTGQSVPIRDLARFIEQRAGRPVIDETGLTGRYDFKIQIEGFRRPTDAGVPTDPAPSIFNVVEQQLGLKLESASSSIDHLIIDSIDREPTEN